MKHLFTVHSPITYLAALGVIEHEKIDDQDVIFICNNRHLTINTKYKVVSLYQYEHDLMYKLLKPNLSRNIDRLIDSSVNNSGFTAYIDLFTLRNRILITHSKCHAFHVIEEGMQTYMDHDTLESLTFDISNRRFRRPHGITGIMKLLKRSFTDVIRGYEKSLISLPYALRNYSKVKGLRYYVFDSVNALPGVPRSKVIKIDFPFQKHSNSYLDISNSVVFVEDSLADWFYNGKKLFYSSLLKNEPNILRLVDNKNVFVKLRPGQKSCDSQVVEFLDEYNIEYTVLPSEIFLEPELKKSEQVTLIGVVSALLFYGALMGHRSYSLFLNYPSSPQTAYHNNLSAFWKKVTLIK